MKEFLKAQANQSSPLEFLKLYAGHALIKDQILKQWPKVSMDLQEDKEYMKISGRTVVQAAEVTNQVRDTQNLKQKMQPALEKAKGQFELKQQALLQNQKSTKFITKLFKRGQDEFGGGFRQNTSNNENFSKNTGVARQTMDFARGSRDDPLQDESNKPQKEVGTLIERLFNSIEKKLKISEYGGQVDEALRCSVFGEFSKNFKQYQTHMKQYTDNKHHFSEFFRESAILGEELLMRALLFFNLPYETIVREQLQPERVFHYSSSQKERVKVSHMCTKPEFAKSQTPSVVLMKIESGTDEETSAAKSYVIGGFASHSWSESPGGDASCFLFNLTLNLRFTAREGLPSYTSCSEDELRFGETDLVVKNGFKSVRSKMTVPTPAAQD